MLPREQTELFEKQFLNENACLSVDSKGRKEPCEPCPLRTCFQRDRDRILHCNSFRRLKHKTQVYLSPAGDHYRTRLTHTLEVSQIARTISRALRLNEDLTESHWVMTLVIRLLVMQEKGLSTSLALTAFTTMSKACV